MVRRIFSTVCILLGVITLFSCKSSNTIVNEAVEKLNNNCPVTLQDMGILQKVEYNKNDLIFYINHSFFTRDSIPYTEIKQLQNSQKARDFFIKKLFSNKSVSMALSSISQADAEEEKLYFRFIYKDRESGDSIEYHIEWRDILPVTSKVLNH